MSWFWYFFVVYFCWLSCYFWKSQSFLIFLLQIRKLFNNFDPGYANIFKILDFSKLLNNFQICNKKKCVIFKNRITITRNILYILYCIYWNILYILYCIYWNILYIYIIYNKKISKSGHFQEKLDFCQFSKFTRYGIPDAPFFTTQLLHNGGGFWLWPFFPTAQLLEI